MPIEPRHVRHLATKLNRLVKSGGGVAAIELSEHGPRERQMLLPFNLSAFLVEELVIDETANSKTVNPVDYLLPVDYRVYVVGGTVLFVLLTFPYDGGVLNGAVDENYEALPPAMDKDATSHRVCESPNQLPRQPTCWAAMMHQARALGDSLNILARLDMFADITHGPLLSEITLLPNMGDPPTLFRHWVNEAVQSHWQEPDGCALAPVEPSGAELLPAATLRDAICRSSHGVVFPLTATALLALLDEFDLAPWGVAPGDCVALLVPSGPYAAALLLATMNRYHATPLDPAAPEAVICARLPDLGARCVCAINASTGRLNGVCQVAVSAAQAIGVAWVPIELRERKEDSSFRLLLPARPSSTQGGPPSRSLNEVVLTLHTSGTTGQPKQVPASLRGCSCSFA